MQSKFTKLHIAPLLIQTHDRIGKSHLPGTVDVNVGPAPYVVVISFDRIFAISSIPGSFVTVFPLTIIKTSKRIYWKIAFALAEVCFH